MSEKRWCFSIEHLCGTSGAVVLMVTAIVMGGGSGFINIPSLMITFGVAFFMMFACFRGEYMRYLWASVVVLFCRPMRPNRRYAEMSLYAARFMFAAGVSGTLIGFIQMLRNLSDPSSIGAGMAVSLITVLYAVFAAEFWCVFVYKAFSGDDEKDGANHKLPSAYPLGVVAGVVLWALFLFFVILMTFYGFEDSSARKPSGYSVTEDGIARYFMRMGDMKVNVHANNAAAVLLINPVMGMSDPACHMMDDYGPLLRDLAQKTVKNGQKSIPFDAAEGPEALKKLLKTVLNEKIATFSKNRITEIYFDEYILLPNELGSRSMRD